MKERPTVKERMEKQISTRPVFDGKIINVTVDEVELENGKTAPREVVHHGGGAGVLAVNEKGEIALVRQYRYAAGRVMTEIPAGKLEAGEDPREAAIRELAEEAGLEAGRVVDFGSILPTCAYCTERIYLYLATELREVPAHPDEDEFVDLFWLPLAQAVEKIMGGEIDDAKTVSAVLRLALVTDGKNDL
jgi:ADP-ribose pyrophosphatase